MNAETLAWISIGLSVAAALAYGYVGALIGRRRVSVEARIPLRLFSAWWYCIAAGAAVQATANVLAKVDALTLDLFVSFTYLQLGIISAALYTLVYYLVYLFTGWKRIGTWLAVPYAMFYFALVYLVTVSHPQGLDMGPGGVQITYGDPVSGPFAAVAGALLVVPPLLAAFLYLSLAFVAKDRTQRYRVILVAAGIIVWFSVSFLLVAKALEPSIGVQLLARFLGLAAASSVVLAYLPPPWIRKRWGIRSIKDETPYM